MSEPSPLASAAGLKTDSLAPLAGHLRRLVALLQDAYALKFGHIRRQRGDAAAAARLSAEVCALADIAFDRVERALLRMLERTGRRAGVILIV